MNCIGENSEKYKTFSVIVKTEEITVKNKDGNEKEVNLNYSRKFIDSFNFMNMSLDTIVNNLSELYNQKCIYCKEKNKIKQCKYSKIHNKKVFLQCLECENYQYKQINYYTKKFSNTYK